MRLREWVAGSAVLLTYLSFAGEEFRASGIVERIEPGRVVLNVSSDNCSGSHELILKDVRIEGTLSEGRKVFFRASGNPCLEEEVYLLEVRSGVFTEAEDEQAED